MFIADFTFHSTTMIKCDKSWHRESADCELNALRERSSVPRHTLRKRKLDKNAKKKKSKTKQKTPKIRVREDFSGGYDRQFGSHRYTTRLHQIHRSSRYALLMHCNRISVSTMQPHRWILPSHDTVGQPQQGECTTLTLDMYVYTLLSPWLLDTFLGECNSGRRIKIFVRISF